MKQMFEHNNNLPDTPPVLRLEVGMKRSITKLKSRRGVSLIELMIAAIITAIITTGVMRLYLTQHRSYMVQDDLTTIQQNARASIDELTRHIRMAGHQLPAGLQAIETYDANPDTIVLQYRSGNCDTYLSSRMPQPSAELKCGNSVDCFYAGQWVYIYDPDDETGEFFEITHVQGSAQHLQHRTMRLSKAYDEDAQIFSMTRAKFYVDNTTDPDHPNLMVQYWSRTPQVYAENITDLQFQYLLRNGTTVDEVVIASDVREVSISIDGRGENPDYESPNQDVYRSRNYSTSVFVRNLGN